jgi:hypothetical protein
MVRSRHLLGEVSGLDEPVAKCADHRLDLPGEPFAVEPGQRLMDELGAAVEFEVETLGYVIRDGHFTPDVAFAASQAHPPGFGGNGLPLHRVHEVLATGEAAMKIILTRTPRTPKGAGQPVRAGIAHKTFSSGLFTCKEQRAKLIKIQNKSKALFLPKKQILILLVKVLYILYY